MADTDFFNRNLFRAYPLVEGPPYTLDLASFPQRVLVEFGIVFREGSGFDPDSADHKIHPLVAEAGGVQLRIAASGAASIDGEILTIAAAGDFEMVPFSNDYAYGFAVFGDVSSIPVVAADLPASADLTFVERRCIHVHQNHYVTRLLIANEQRTVARDRCGPSGSSSSSSVAASGYETAPGGDNFIGDVRFREGFNCQILVQSIGNAIRFSARRGAGLGEACEEVPRTWDELTRFDAGETLDGAVRCYEALSNVNGIGPDSGGGFVLRAGRGIEITSPADHTIRIAGREALEACDG